MWTFLLYFLAFIGAAVVLLLVIGRLRIGAVRRRLEAQFADTGVTERAPARLVGRASLGQNQQAQPGILGLAPDSVVFATLVGDDPLNIERETITSVSLDRRFMGWSAKSDMLVITWDQNGMGDAAAFAVQDPAAWQDRLTSRGEADHA